MGLTTVAFVGPRTRCYDLTIGRIAMNDHEPEERPVPGETDPFAPPTTPTDELPEVRKGHILAGVGYCLLGHCALISFSVFVEPFLLVMIGLLQALYVVPTWVWQKNEGNMATVQGLLIMAGITFLLNAACFGLVFVSMGDFH